MEEGRMSEEVEIASEGLSLNRALKEEKEIPVRSGDGMSLQKEEREM